MLWPRAESVSGSATHLFKAIIWLYKLVNDFQHLSQGKTEWPSRSRINIRTKGFTAQPVLQTMLESRGLFVLVLVILLFLVLYGSHWLASTASALRGMQLYTKLSCYILDLSQFSKPITTTKHLLATGLHTFFASISALRNLPTAACMPR